MTREIKVQDLLDFKYSNSLIYVQSHEKLKSLHITLTGNYEVWHKRKRIYEGTSEIEAVNTYNNI